MPFCTRLVIILYVPFDFSIVKFSLTRTTCFFIYSGTENYFFTRDYRFKYNISITTTNTFIPIDAINYCQQNRCLKTTKTRFVLYFTETIFVQRESRGRIYYNIVYYTIAYNIYYLHNVMIDIILTSTFTMETIILLVFW